MVYIIPKDNQRYFKIKEKKPILCGCKPKTKKKTKEKQLYLFDTLNNSKLRYGRVKIGKADTSLLNKKIYREKLFKNVNPFLNDKGVNSENVCKENKNNLKTLFE